MGKAKRFVLIFLVFISLFLATSCQTKKQPDDKGNNIGPNNQDEDVKKEEEKVIATRKSFKLLCIGNSFSDNALNYAYSILNSFGVQEIVLGNLYIGGCDITTHTNNAATDTPNYVYRKNTSGQFKSSNGTKMSTALRDEEWDYVTLQQSSGKSGMIDTYNAEINALNNFARDSIKNEKLKVGWHMTWAYAADSNHNDFPKYNNSQMEMYGKIVSCVKEKIVPNPKFDFIIPAGTAIQNARTSYLGDTFTADGYHLEDLGEFIAGMSLVLEITNWNIDDLNLDLIPQKFIPYLDVVKESVLNALEKPFEVTNSTILNDPRSLKEKSEFTVTNNVSYSDAANICKLDMYLPKKENFDVIIHFHGGGLNSGSKGDAAHVAIATTVAEGGVGFISVNYRLYPTCAYPDFLVDAANAIKYVKDYLEEHNIKGKVYVSGQSAGAYIGLMLCFNQTFLNNVGLNVTDIDGWIMEAGQPTTHFNVLGADGLDTQLQRIDEKAPLYYINGSTKFKKLLLITYTNDIACRPAQTWLTYQTILNYNPNAKVEMRMYEGNHCVNSTTAYRGFYIHAQILLDYVNSNK